MNIISDIYQINTGDNLLVSTESFLGDAIQEFQKCKWNHSAKFLWLHDKLYIVEAEKRGECITPFEYYTSNPAKYQLCIQKQRITQTPLQVERWIHYALEKCGKSTYGYTNLLIAQPVKYLFGAWIGAKSLEKVENRGFICGQLVAYLDHLTYGWYPNNEWIPIAPVDLYKSGHYENFIWKP